MKSMYIIDFVSFLGYINNDTGIQGKAFIFNVIHEPVFECVLFVHPQATTFVTIPEEITNIDNEQLIQSILNTYKLEELLQYEN